MSNSPVFSEKAAEILFNRFFLQTFALGSVQLFAPSSIEEFRNGYDTKVTGCSSLREIYLQFKAPKYSERRRLFTVQLTAHQHRRLQDFYPAHAAYYVAAMFTSLAEVNSAQASVKTATDFLKHFVCIQVASLPSDVDFLHYIRPSSHRGSPCVKFKVPNDEHSHTASHPIHADAWLRGNTLAARFNAGTVGVRWNLTNGYQGATAKAMRAVEADEILDSREGQRHFELGVLLRTQDDLLTKGRVADAHSR